MQTPESRALLSSVCSVCLAWISEVLGNRRILDVEALLLYEKEGFQRTHVLFHVLQPAAIAMLLHTPHQ